VVLAAQRPVPPADPASLLARAEQLRSEGKADSYRAAIPLFEQAQAALERAHNAIGQADAATGLGRCYDALGDKKRGIELFDHARAVYRAEGKPAAEAQVLNYSALAFNYLGDRDRAQSALDTALILARQAGDVRVEALTLNNQGFITSDRGDRIRGLELLNQALPLHRQVGNVRGEATTLANIGTVYDRMGEKQRALEHLTQSITLRRQIGDPRDLAVGLNNIGVVHFSLDDFERARAFYTEALPYWRQSGDAAGEAATLHNIANTYEFTGEYQSALDYYRRAIPLQRASRFREGEANTLTNMGRLYFSLGERARAVESYTHAIELHRAVQNRPSESVALANLGALLLASGERSKATDLFSQALALARTTSDRAGQATILNNLGRVAAADGQLDRASDYHRQALELFQAAGSRRGEGTTYALMGAVDGAHGDINAARAAFDHGLSLMRQIGDRSGEAQALYALASAERSNDNLEAAHDRIESALALVESLRTKVDRSDFRSSFFASVQDYFTLAIDVLMRLDRSQPGHGYAAAALQTSERARARSLLDLLGEAGADIRNSVDPDQLERARSLERTINARAERLAQIVAGRADDQASRLAHDIEALTADFNDVDARIRQASPRYAAITERRPATLDRIEALTDPDTRLLEFALGVDRSYLWIVSPSGLVTYELPPRATIETAAREFVALISVDRPSGDVDAAAVRLSQMLLLPAADQLSVRRLLVVADGALQYVPFAGLTATREYRPLAFDHEIVSLPSASTLAALRDQIAARTSAPRTLAILADPVFRFDDPRVERAATDSREPSKDTKARLVQSDGPAGGDALVDQFGPLPRLIGSRREAARIAALLPASDRKEALDFEASRATLASPAIADYRIVHLATHGLLNASHPDLSGIVLSLVDRRGRPQNGFLRLHDIYNLKLTSDLVVLSACQTALGRDIRGEGLVGLTRGFMYAGASRVVASLWRVDDRATSELMVHFYRGMLGPAHLPAAAALREAQTRVAKEARWRSPYYWAGFVLQGEWR
jgi:CHAT domain-containing protein/tetratricopeptide (TPR) repeat protein